MSINPKKTEGYSHGTLSQNANNVNMSNMRVKRIGPLNKGDKIKFGVLVPKEK